MKSGKGTEDDHVPNLWYFNEIDYLGLSVSSSLKKTKIEIMFSQALGKVYVPSFAQTSCCTDTFVAKKR